MKKLGTIYLLEVNSINEYLYNVSSHWFGCSIIIE